MENSIFTISHDPSDKNKPLAERIIGFSYVQDFSEAQQDIGSGVDLFIEKNYDKIKDVISKEKK